MDTSPFAGKALDYERNRVDSPQEAIERVIAHAALSGHEVVADLGSGTGLLSRRLLPHVALLHAVEPDDAMRRVAEAALAREPKFRSVAGTAEETRLPAQSVDVITCGNSFHYFDPQRAGSEALRILRPHGRAVLLSHDAPETPNAFMADYLRFLKEKTRPALASVHSPADHLRRVSLFFGERQTTTDSGEQSESLTWDALRGRFLSSSIAPRPHDPAYESALRELEAIFERHQRDGHIAYELLWTCRSCLLT
jgi:ubiquinone/menaquinone biosynthesis C-methylase UbiE